MINDNVAKNNFLSINKNNIFIQKLNFNYDKSKKSNVSWGNNIKTFPKIFYPEKNLDVLRIFKNKNNFVIQGNRRSYGTCV